MECNKMCNLNCTDRFRKVKKKNLGIRLGMHSQCLLTYGYARDGLEIQLNSNNTHPTLDLSDPRIYKYYRSSIFKPILAALYYIRKKKTDHNIYIFLFLIELIIQVLLPRNPVYKWCLHNSHFSICSLP